jgi:hypothetical protein
VDLDGGWRELGVGAYDSPAGRGAEHVLDGGASGARTLAVLERMDRLGQMDSRSTGGEFMCALCCAVLGEFR